MRKTTTRKTAGPRPPAADAKSSDDSPILEALTRYLALRDHSRFELRTKLGRKYPLDLVDRALNEAERNNWLMPEDQIAERLALALARRHKSEMYIAGQLRRRQLPVPPLDFGDTELENIRHWVTRKFGADPLTDEQKGEAYRFLQYRGFKDHAIKQVLNEER